MQTQTPNQEVRHPMSTFTLDRDVATSWFGRILKARAGDTEAAARLADFSPDFSPEWDPRAIRSEHEVYLLVRTAQKCGVVNAPHPAQVEFEYREGGEAGRYQWIVTTPHTPPLRLASDAEDMCDLGDPDARGTEAALGVLKEAVETANQLVADLAAHVAAQQARQAPR